MDIVPRREVLARYGLTVGDVNRVVEAAIGGTPIGVTVEGRNRFTVNVRYPQDLRSDLDRLRRVLVPVKSARGGGAGGMGSLGEPRLRPVRLAQAMGASGGAADAGGKAIGNRPFGTVGGGEVATDAPSLGWIGSVEGAQQSALTGATDAAPGAAAVAFVPLGQLADVRIVGGPPMIRDENGLLAGYVYVDIDTASRDVGGYVEDAKRAVRAAQDAGTLAMPVGYVLEWTGQYESLETMRERMRFVLPATLLLIVLLLWLHFRNFTEVLIVLLSIPFALVGSVWLLWAARLPPLDGGLGRRHRARRARRADRRRDDRLHRQRLRAPPRRRQDPRPLRHRLGPHGGDGPCACGRSS